MFYLLLKQLKGLFTKNNSILVDGNDEVVDKRIGFDEDKLPTKEKEFTDMLESACAKFTFYIREDGEFAVTSEFFRSDEDVIEVSSTVLHMLNSGMLSEYFMKSLKLWGQNSEEQKFILEILKGWKVLYDEDADVDKKSNKRFKLAVDPSDVFGLKSLKDAN